VEEEEPNFEEDEYTFTDKIPTDIFPNKESTPAASADGVVAEAAAATPAEPKPSKPKVKHTTPKRPKPNKWVTFLTSKSCLFVIAIILKMPFYLLQQKLKSV
jgi:hypothetical protein